MAALNFDASQVPERSFDPLPAGDYLVWITESDVPTDQEGNQKVELTMEVVGPEQYQGRKCFASCTLNHNTQPKWAETGRGVLATICRAVGVMAPRETEELHQIPFWVRLEVEAWKDGSLHNECKAYWHQSSQAPPPPKKKAQPPKPQAPAPGYQTGYMPQGQPAWQPPAQPQGPVVQHGQNFLHTQAPPAQYQAPQPQYHQPQPQAYQAPGGQPPWAQQQPPQQGGQTPF